MLQYVVQWMLLAADKLLSAAITVPVLSAFFFTLYNNYNIPEL